MIDISSQQPKHNDNKSKLSVGEGPIITTQDMLDCYHGPCPFDTSSNSDSKLANPTDHPSDNSNSSVHTMAIYPEINQRDDQKDTHINVITSLTTGS